LLLIQSEKKIRELLKNPTKIEEIQESYQNTVDFGLQFICKWRICPSSSHL